MTTNIHELQHLLVTTARFTTRQEARHSISGLDALITLTPGATARQRLVYLQDEWVESILDDIKRLNIVSYGAEDRNNIRRVP